MKMHLLIVVALLSYLQLGEAATDSPQPNSTSYGMMDLPKVSKPQRKEGAPLAHDEASSTIQVGDTNAACNSGKAGTLRYESPEGVLELCNGLEWTQVLTDIGSNKGASQSSPGLHCLDILNSGASHGDGLYWIDPNGGSTDDAFQAYCDMTTEKGGWTLFATKVTPSFNFMSPSFSAQAAKSTDSNAASKIHPAMGDWTEVLFRFSNRNDIRVVYSREGGGSNSGKQLFDNFLQNPTKNAMKHVNGFYKYSPATGGKRKPKLGLYHTINYLFFYKDHSISEWHRGGTDKWLNIWRSTIDQTNNYDYSDNTKARGTKCVAGYCYMTTPIWVMVR